MDRIITAEEWLAPGRKTITGYLLASRGPWKKDYGLVGNLVAAIVEEKGIGKPPRYQDLHSIWFGFDSEGEPNNQMVRPFLRYKSSRPIDGFRFECRYHRVELTCTVGEQWSNGLGAYITKASGRCLECEAVDA